MCAASACGEAPHLGQAAGLTGTVHSEPPLAHRRVHVEECSSGTQERELLVAAAHVVHLQGATKKCEEIITGKCGSHTVTDHPSSRSQCVAKAVNHLLLMGSCEILEVMC